MTQTEITERMEKTEKTLEDIKNSLERIESLMLNEIEGLEIELKILMKLY